MLNRTWPKSTVKILIPELKEPFPGHPEFQIICPSYGSTDINSWENHGETGEITGGKDCHECHALSRRWQGAGAGQAIWIVGPGIHPGITVKQTEEILSSLLEK